MSGWTNDSINTLIVPTGATSGERVIIANQTNGDAIDIYDTANQLVFSIDKNGRLVSYSSVSTANIVMVAASLLFEDTAESPQVTPRLSASLGPDNAFVFITGGVPQNAAGGTSPPFLTLQCGDTPGSPWIGAAQRNVQGAMIQTDQSTDPPTDNLVHGGVYSGQVSGGDGHWVFAHNCAFTPSRVDLTPYAAGGGDGPGYVRMWTTATDSTFCYTIWRNDGGGITANGTTVGVHATFWG